MCLVWLKRISIQQTLKETQQVNESINNDPNNTVINDDDNLQKTTWVAEPVLEYPEYKFECFHCGTETEEHEGYLKDGECYCDSCAYDLFDQPKPKSKYTDEMWEKFHKICQEEPKEDVVSIIPTDAILIDEDYTYCKTYERAKEVLKTTTCDKTDVTQELHDAYIVSQNNNKFWFKLTQDINIPNKFIITLYAPKDEVAKKYLRRMLEDCIYRMDYIINPEDYPCEATSASEAAEEDYDTYYTNKALCVTCGEINYAEPVYEVEGRSRMICCDCIEITNRCQECNNLTLDYVYHNEQLNKDLCFDCKFKKPLTTQMPLAVHLAIRSDIQFLTRKQFDILTDYAELAQLTIFDAYRYKSRCHYYDCDRMIQPSKWNAEEAVQFCCHRHADLADLNGCHCQNVYDGNNYDEDYEQATCKVCNSNHETNMIPRIELKNSDQGVKPIVSAICVFNEGIKMSNILAESLVDLCEYFD